MPDQQEQHIPTPTSFERNALAEYDITPAKVAEMAKEYMTLKVIEGDTGSYKAARAALTLCVTTRTSTDKHRKKLGEEARTWIKDVNLAATKLLEPLIPVEDHLRTELGREDERKAKIKAEKEEKELKRVTEIKEKIEVIRSFSASLTWELTVEELNVIMGNLEVLAITPDEYMEFTTEAGQVRHDVQVALHKAIGVREKFEEEEAARKKEDERLAAERAELDAKYEQQAKEQAKIDEEKAKVEAEKKRIEDEEFKKKAEADAKEKAERDLKEKQEREAREKEEKEKAEAKEKARMEAMKTDKRKMLDWLEALQLTTLPPFVDDPTLLSLGQEISVELENVIKAGKNTILKA